MQDQTLINGLLAKREELSRENAELRERMAIVANDIEAVDRVLESCGFKGELEVCRAVTKPSTGASAQC